jgi:hypothetical protein
VALQSGSDGARCPGLHGTITEVRRLSGEQSVHLVSEIR